MSSPEDALTKRVKHLEKYTNTLHMVLDNAIQRIRKLEAATGMDEEGIQQTLEWRGKIEAMLTKAMLEHNWYWQDSEDPQDVALGNVTYSRILKLCEMLPVDVQMRCWNQVDTPNDLPLVWSEESPTYEHVSSDIKDQSNSKLLKTLREVNKHDPK